MLGNKTGLSSQAKQDFKRRNILSLLRLYETATPNSAKTQKTPSDPKFSVFLQKPTKYYLAISGL
jgi:hypothetical protein